MAEELCEVNVLVGCDTGCAGSDDTFRALVEEIQRQGLAGVVQVARTGCLGFCSVGPVVSIYPEGILYCRVSADDVPELVETTLANGRLVKRLMYKEPLARQDVPFYREIPFYSKQMRITLRNCGMIDPESIEEFIARGGYEALAKAVTSMTPDEVIAAVKRSGLRGRGGAGFTTGMKWQFAARAPGDVKYVVCNADEGDPGAFMDRSVIEGDPHSVLEGMAVCGYAIGANKGYIYLRAEYHYLLDLLKSAISQAKERGFLQHFDIEIREGAGSYICGEESALMDSIEGKRGEVRFRPPFPPSRGLWGKPTIINNVETLMNIPQIILNGADWFSQMGTERSKGTKVFSVSGDVKKPGVYELVLGSRLRELVEELALAEEVKMVQVGGATGRIIPYEMMDTPLAFEGILGAGAVIVFDESRDIIDIAYRTMEFLAEECCGKCAPGREGTEVMVEILRRFSRGEGLEKDIKVLEELSDAMKLSSLCGLGQAAPIPVLDSLQYFRDAYENRIQKN